ncbi:hypothetical protein F5X99DRAFT_375867 [Biscogniauxia marginata]|nr:hypothetical protein F5X99DRAFT_375867 [Biscogniauxia marginata]
MESPPPSTDLAGESFDSSKPFQGLVLCCTSIEADQRTEIAQRVTDMGGVHKYDLTPDVTHLIVGDYNTAKYRHVAKERPDIKPMAAGWVEAVRILWLEDREMDFAALENEWRLRTLEASGGIPNSPIPQERERTKLVCCLTGFEDNEIRTMIEDKVTNNGGEFTPDLSRRVTHLIACRPDGKKYQAARRWGICTVSIEWLHDSVERGMILNEECYDPTLAPEERGKGAWTRRELRRVSTGKRLRDSSTPAPEVGRRKLRKTASMKLSHQRDNLWGDILVNQSSIDLSKPNLDERAQSVPDVPAAESIIPAVETAPPTIQLDNVDPQVHREGVFAQCRFCVYGFPKLRENLVCAHLSSHGGQLSSSLEDVASLRHAEPLECRYLVVPQASQPDTHPQLPEGVHIVTEFFIERCIHNKTLFSPNEHVLGQPFPRFPIDGFQNLIICTTGFKNEQLNQMEKTITQLGAKYSERFNSQSSLLVCPALQDVRKQKLDFAILSNIPVVEAEWLWQCITTGCLVPWDKFLFKELGQKVSTDSESLKKKEREKLPRTRSEPMPKRLKPVQRAQSSRAGIDTTAFDDETVINDSVRGRQNDSELYSHYDTAPTHLAESIDTGSVSAPLSEAKSNALNKSTPSPNLAQPPQRKLKRFPTGGEVGDSDSGEDSDTTTRPSKEGIITAAPAAAAVRDEETERKHKAEQVQAAERKRLSERLNSLMSHSEAPKTPAPEGGGEGLKPLPGAAGATRPPQRRKREVFGRAASNVSAASSASADSSGTRSISRLERQGSTTTGFLLDRMMMEPGGESGMADNSAEQQPPPPATQLGYDNPEAREHRAVVMDRMLGHNADGKSGSGSSSSVVGGQGRSQEKLRMGDLKGADMAGIAGRRSMRKR